MESKLVTLPGTAMRRAQVNYISGKGAFSGECISGQRGWFVIRPRTVYLKCLIFRIFEVRFFRIVESRIYYKLHVCLRL